jgi:WD40 repeat protein
LPGSTNHPPNNYPTAANRPPHRRQVRTFEAHSDYIRSIAVHPTLPYLLTSSDDMLIKLWDWDKGWSCVQVRGGSRLMEGRFVSWAPRRGVLPYPGREDLGWHQ